jgi:hypothetical protein
LRRHITFDASLRVFDVFLCAFVQLVPVFGRTGIVVVVVLFGGRGAFVVFAGRLGATVGTVSTGGAAVAGAAAVVGGVVGATGAGAIGTGTGTGTGTVTVTVTTTGATVVVGFVVAGAPVVVGAVVGAVVVAGGAVVSTGAVDEVTAEVAEVSASTSSSGRSVPIGRLSAAVSSSVLVPEHAERVATATSDANIASDLWRIISWLRTSTKA